MRKYLSFISIVSSTLLLAACSSIEHRSEMPDKKPLAPIQAKKVEVKSLWSSNANSGVGKKNAKLLVSAAKEALVTADYKGNVIATDVASGQTLWKRDLNKAISAGPTTSNEAVYVATSDANLLALDLQTGETLWTTPTTSEVLAAPSYHDGVIFIHAMDGGLSALSATDGRQLWRFALNMPELILRRSSSPVVTPSHVVAGFASGKLVAFKRFDGSVDWAQDVGVPRGRSDIQRMIDVSADPVVVDDVAYAVSYQGNLVAHVASNGQLLWEREISSYSGLSVDNHSVYVTATNGEVWALYKGTGETYWVQPALKGRRLSKPVLKGQYILVGDDDGIVHWIDRTSGQLVGRYTVDSKGVEAPPVLVDDKVVVLSKGGKLVALQTQDVAHSSKQEQDS